MATITTITTITTIAPYDATSNPQSHRDSKACEQGFEQMTV